MMTRWTFWSTARLTVLGVCVLSGAAATRPLRDAAPASALWEMPADLEDRDLFFGSWGEAHAPDPRDTYTFVRPKHNGVNPGVVVRDGRGRIWHVKQPPHNSQGAEGPVEVVLSRVLDAIGYHQPPVYFLPSFTLADAKGAHVVEPGGRFRLDEPSMKARGSWPWVGNALAGTRPYEGLLVILLVFNSWDLKDSNNTIYDVRRDGGVEPWYVVRDLGAALGETGRLAPKRNNIEKFERQTFITGVTGGFVDFTYRGWQPRLVRGAITVEDVRWAAALLSRLSDRQWHDAFRAGGFTDNLSERFIRKLKANIAEGR